MVRALPGATNPGQNGPESNVNKGAISISLKPQNSRTEFFIFNAVLRHIPSNLDMDGFFLVFYRPIANNHITAIDRSSLTL